MIVGSGPRLYADTVNLPGRVPVNSNDSLTVAFRSPLDDFTNALNELALRYALTDVPENNPERVKTNNEYLSAYDDRRKASTPTPIAIPPSATSLTAVPAKSQTVLLVEQRSVAVFRQNSGLTTAVTVLVLVGLAAAALLLSGGWLQGRIFSTSPTEIAKAFDAPVLAHVASGSDVDSILAHMGNIKVRYGEARTEEEMAKVGVKSSYLVDVEYKEGRDEVEIMEEKAGRKRATAEKIQTATGAEKSSMTGKETDAEETKVTEQETETGTEAEAARRESKAGAKKEIRIVVDQDENGGGAGSEAETGEGSEATGQETMTGAVPAPESGNGKGLASETERVEGEVCNESKGKGLEERKGKQLEPALGRMTGSEIDLEAGPSVGSSGSHLEVGKATGKEIGSGLGSGSGSRTRLGSESGSYSKTDSRIFSVLESRRRSEAGWERGRRLVVDRVERVKTPERGYRYVS